MKKKYHYSSTNNIL